MGIYGKIKKARALSSGFMRLSDFFDPFQLRDDFFSQPFPDRAAVEAHKIIHTDLHQLLAPDQIQPRNLAVIVSEAAAVDQVFNAVRVKVREGTDSAAGLIRPPSVSPNPQ